MKRKLGLIAAFILASNVFAYQNFFGFSLGLLSGIPFYGSSEINDLNKEIKDENRFIIGTLCSFNFNVSDNATFFVGSDLVADFLWHNDYCSNHLNYDFSLGVKVFPNLAGFCTGLAYVLGSRADFLNTETVTRNSNSAWGNGIKLLAEYNFAHDGKSNHYPTLGMFWKIMPRGNDEYDNQICAYIMANF